MINGTGSTLLTTYGKGLYIKPIILKGQNQVLLYDPVSGEIINNTGTFDYKAKIADLEARVLAFKSDSNKVIQSREVALPLLLLN